MTLTVSQEALSALKPRRLGGDQAHLIRYDGNEIILPAAQDEGGGEGGGDRRRIKTEEIIFVAEVQGGGGGRGEGEGKGGGYVVLALRSNEAQPGRQEEGEEEEEEEEAEGQPFRLSSFLAPTLPQALLERHLLAGLPGFLRGASGPGPGLDVIVSVRSGTGLAQGFYDAVLRPLLGVLGLEGSLRVAVTRDAHTVRDFAVENWGAEARGGNTTGRTVLLLSGDGGIVDLLNGMAAPAPARLPTVVLLPLGTGNALFHSLHRPHAAAAAAAAATTTTTTSPLALALRALLRGRPAPLPTFTAAFSPGARLVRGDEHAGAPPGDRLTGAIVASYGFHAQLVWESDTPAYRRHGDRRFGMVAQELLRDLHGYDAEVAVASSSSSSSSSWRVVGGGDGGGGAKVNYALVTMVSNLERTFTISPDSRPLDGKLRLVCFGGKTGEETMAIMMAAYDGGRHVGMDGVAYRQEDEVRVTSLETDARWRKVCVDGTIVELAEGGSMVVRTDPDPRLNVVVLDA